MTDILEDSFFLDDYVRFKDNCKYPELVGYIGQIRHFSVEDMAVVNTGQLFTVKEVDNEQITASVWYIPIGQLDRFESKDAAMRYVKERAKRL